MIAIAIQLAKDPLHISFVEILCSASGVLSSVDKSCF